MSARAAREIPLFPLLDRPVENVRAMDFDAIWNMADELRDVLPIFSLTEEERRELVTHMHVRRFRPGEVDSRRAG